MLNKLDNLLITVIGEERTNEYGKVISLIRSINGNVLEYLEDIESLDEDTFSKENFLDLVNEAIRKSIYKIFKENNIILSEDELSKLNINKLGGLILSLVVLVSLKDSNDLSTMFLINDVLESTDDSKVYDIKDDLSKLVYILNFCSDLLSLEEYYNLIEKVYPEFIINLSFTITETLSSIDPYGDEIVTNDDDDDEVIKIFTLTNIIINRLISKGFDFIPQSLLDITSDSLNITLFKNNAYALLNDRKSKIKIGLNVASNIFDYVFISMFSNRDHKDLVDLVNDNTKDIVLEIFDAIDKDENDIIKTTIEKIKDIG